jgi:hypothetical protein
LTSVYSKRNQKEKKIKCGRLGGIEEEINGRADGRKMIYVIYINCNWLATSLQQYSTHMHTNNIQNDTKIRKSAGRAPSLWVLPWHSPYN